MPCWQRRGVTIFAVMITHTRRRQIIRSHHRLATCSCLLLFAWPWRAVRIVELDKGPRWPGSDRLLLYDGTTSLRHCLSGSSMVVVLEPLPPRSQSQLRWTTQSLQEYPRWWIEVWLGNSQSSTARSSKLSFLLARDFLVWTGGSTCSAIVVE